MALVNDISYILNDEFISENSVFHEHGHYIDANGNKQPFNMNIDIDCNGCVSKIYKYDKELKREFKGGLFPFFAKKAGVCQICDYIIFAEARGEHYVIIAELKRGDTNTRPQLEAAKEFAKFIIATTNRIHKKSYDPIFRYISIHEINIRKRGTCEKGIQYDSHSHCEIKSDRIKLKLLLK